MCATVCPSGALFFGTREEIEKVRRERPMNAFRFGSEQVTTKVRMMMPGAVTELEVDVADLTEGDADGGTAGLEGRLPDFVGR
jgi:ferredoxin